MAQVSFRIDDGVKTKAENACAAMGITMSAAISIFLTKVANEKRIPFEVSVDPFYNEEHIAMLEKRIAEMKAGNNMHEHDIIEAD